MSRTRPDTWGGGCHYKIFVELEAFIQDSTLWFANTPFVCAPHFPFTAHTIAQYNVSPRPSVLAIHTIQDWL